MAASFQANLSGASWNESRQQLWLAVNNPGTVVCLKKTSTGSMKFDSVGTAPMRWNLGGDLEAICQANENDSSFFVLVEDLGLIRRYKYAPNGVVMLLRTWNLSAYLPVYANGLGPEGMTFVSNTWLQKRGFKNASGQSVLGSMGFGGLFFVAHQNGGKIYAFDLSANTSQVTFHGAFQTSRTESSSLEIDRSTGRLFVWHNLGPNYLEVCDLASVPAPGGRKLISQKEFLGPESGNLEGIAFAPSCSGSLDAFICDDANANGHGLMWYRQFRPCVPRLDFQVLDSTLCTGDSLRLQNLSCGTCPGDVWVWKVGTETISGAQPLPIPNLAPGSYSPRLFWANGFVDSLSAPAQVQIVYRPFVDLPWHDTTVCQTASTFTFPQGIGSWTGPHLQNGSIPDLSLLLIGEYVYTYTAGDLAFCQVSDSVRLNLQFCSPVNHLKNRQISEGWAIFDLYGRCWGRGEPGEPVPPLPKGIWLEIKEGNSRPRLLQIQD